MKEKHTVIVVLILLGLAVYYSFFEYHAVSEKKGGMRGTPFLELNPEQVKKIEVKKITGETIIGEREGRRWRLVKGNMFENWEPSVNDFLVNLLMCVEIEKFRVESAELKNYGLEAPAFTVTLTDITDKTYQILIGDTNPVRTSIYVKFAESPFVVITGAVLNYEFQKIAPFFPPV